MLLTLIVIPILGAFVISLLKTNKEMSDLLNTTSNSPGLWETKEKLIKTALFVTLLTFIISLVIWAEFDSSSSGYQFTAEYNKVSFCHLHLGIDGFSLYFVLLTTFTIPIAILASWQSIKKNIREYLILLLILESLLIGVFIVLDLLLFYVFFEAVLIPLFLIVGIWGASEARIRASFLLFLYTLLGSLFMLLAFISIYYHVGNTDMLIISLADISLTHQKFLWLAIFFSLAIKTPLVPFHIWLSRAHVEANLAASIILAGIILKLAVYGFGRVLIPYFPEACIFYSPFVQTIGVITIIYASLTCIRQTDFKCLIAYSSVCHIGVVVLGLFSNTIQGIEGGLILSYAHGFVSPALFICVGGILYDRYHTRVITYYRGIVLSIPIFATFFLLFILANMSVPLTANWVGELISLIGMFQINPLAGLLGSLGIIFSACYSIWLYNRVITGTLSINISYNLGDLNRREFVILLTFLIPTFILGIFPNFVLNDLHYLSSSILYMLPDLGENTNILIFITKLSTILPGKKEIKQNKKEFSFSHIKDLTALEIFIISNLVFYPLLFSQHASRH